MKSKPKYTLKKLNALVEKNIPVNIMCDGFLHELKYFRSLRPGEDSYDPEDEYYQDSDGNRCNIVAYVKERPEHIPLGYISQIFVGQEIDRRPIKNL